MQAGLADHVGEPVPVAAQAGPTGIPAVRLTRLLRALRTVGVFDATPEGVVHTDTSRPLRRDVEVTMAPHVRIHLDRGCAAWAGLLESSRGWVTLRAAAWHGHVRVAGRAPGAGAHVQRGDGRRIPGPPQERTEAGWRLLLADHGWVVDSVPPGLLEAATGIG